MKGKSQNQFRKENWLISTDPLDSMRSIGMRTCNHCNKEFPIFDHGQKNKSYCSDICYRRAKVIIDRMLNTEN